MAIAKVFFDINLAMGIPGLTQVAKKQGVLGKDLLAQDFLLFVNRRKTQCKIMWSAKYLLQVRKADGKLTLKDLTLIPQYFKGQIMKEDIQDQLDHHFGTIKSKVTVRSV